MIEEQEGQTYWGAQYLVMRSYCSFLSLAIERNWVKYTQELSVWHLMTVNMSTIVSK